MNILHLVDMVGIAVFAVSGVLAAGRKSLDWFGVLVVGMVTAIGGGTLRDLLLDRHPIFWLVDGWYIGVVLLTTIFTILWVHTIPADFRNSSSRPLFRALLVADAIGLGLFCMQGALIAQSYSLPWPSVLVLATITGVGGGVIRDILTNEIPLILRRDIYATAAIAGVSIFLALTHHRLVSVPWAMVLGVLVVLTIRISAIVWQWKVPRFHWVSQH